MAENTGIQKSESEVARAERTRSGRAYLPNVDIIEKAEELLVLSDMPGTKVEDIDIRYQNGTLDIHAKVEPRGAEGGRMLLHEYGVGDFSRSFQVSEAIDAARIRAEYSDGVLVLHLPKVEAVKPCRISVKAG
ncbi:MAG TPA: Hsp20/alpha crystallin family protein [Phycisphaerae bacterium]|nr:Hsp20/alpha crystallin family protein [Phycisphaerae bacterium]